MSIDMHGTVIERELMKSLKGEVLRDVFLSNYTSLRIGGRTDYLFIPSDINDLALIMESLRRLNTDFFIIGGGTNLLVSDHGFDGAVISLRAFNLIEIKGGTGDDATLCAEAGIPLQALIQYAMREGLSGFEGLIGIPGTLGGAVFGNAGSYGCEIMDLVGRITVLEEGIIGSIERERIKAGYRYGGLNERMVILKACLHLKRDEPEQIKKRMNEFLKLKKETQPLGKRSAGCVFKNPAGYSAGRLIDEAGCKGLRTGDIEVSRLHANFFINRGNGRAVDFITLMERVSERVAAASGIVLEPEIRMVGMF